jgi:acyl-CoA hydrolase
MGIPQDSTIVSKIQETKILEPIDLGDVITVAQDDWITYCATGGLEVVMEEVVKDGRSSINQLRQTSITKFAQTHNVDRKTLYNWKKSIPDFQRRVDERRRQIFTDDRMALVWNGLFMRAAKGDAKQAEMIASHFGDYVPPTQKVQVDVGDNFVDMMSMIQADAQPKQVIEETQQAPRKEPASVSYSSSIGVNDPSIIQEAEVVEPLVQSNVLINTPISTPENTSNPLLPTSTHFDDEEESDPLFI